MNVALVRTAVVLSNILGYYENIYDFCKVCPWHVQLFWTLVPNHNLSALIGSLPNFLFLQKLPEVQLKLLFSVFEFL